MAEGLAMNASELIAFEREVATQFEAGNIRGPVHLSGGNEDKLIEIFKNIDPTDWVFSTWRNHYHALLHGIPAEIVMAQIMQGKSMNLSFPEYRFHTSAIVGGILPIALGVAKGVKEGRVWCFIGDMCAYTGIFSEARKYASGHDLPITFVIEDNGFSTDTPTTSAWGTGATLSMIRYKYERNYPHVGTGKFVSYV